MTYRHLQIVLFLLSLVPNVVQAEYSGEIFFTPDSGKKVIELGPCFLGSSVYAQFVVRNSGTEPVRMLSVSPSLEFFASPTALTPFEYLRFGAISPTLPINIPAQGKNFDTLLVRYFAEPDTLIEPIGRKETMLKLGLVRQNDTNQIVVNEIFKLSSRKTTKFVETFVENLYFDSVWINSPNIITKSIKTRNTQSFTLPILSAKDSLLSQNKGFTEFSFGEKSYPIDIKPKNTTVEWSCSYHPMDLGSDTSLFSIKFLPDPIGKPDSTNTCWTKVIGTGVFQKLLIEDASVRFSGDTLFVGDILIGESLSMRINLNNFGNLRFGVKSQEIIPIENPEALEIISPFLEGRANLEAGGTQYVDILVAPKKKGYFSGVYQVLSNLESRAVEGVQTADLYHKFYIIGRAMAPEIKTISDSIDFGTVVYSGDLFGDCPSSKDTLIRLLNTGNYDLDVKDILLEDDFRFSVSEREFRVGANSDKQIIVTYNSSYPPGEYITKMKIISNALPPNDTVDIVLKAYSVPPVLGKLFIDDSIKAKPGSLINVPILLKGESYFPSVYAKYYNIELTFNPTLLRYDGRNTIGTASEGSSVEVESIERGKIRISTSSDAFLQPNDTLINLRFKTYLGDNVRTELALVNPIFGAGNCKRVLDIKADNGRFSLDSVCGLEFKAQAINLEKLQISSLEPNPAKEKISINLNSPRSASVEFSIVNIYGEEVLAKETLNIEEGQNFLELDISSLPGGYYLLILSDEAGTLSKGVIVQ